jgi:hypothetical protein
MTMTDTNADDVAEAIPVWLDLKPLVRVRVSSEDPAHPLEHAFTPGEDTQWRAGGSGPQVIGLRFEPPRALRRIRLVFAAGEIARTQEFTIRWSAPGGEPHGEVVRQQFTFSEGAARQMEDYSVDLPNVQELQIRIVPDISKGPAVATLNLLQLA